MKYASLTDQQVGDANLKVIEFALNMLKQLKASPESILHISANFLGIMIAVHIKPEGRLRALDMAIDSIKVNFQNLEKNGV